MLQMESSKYLHILLAQIIASILTQNDNDKDFHFLFKLLQNFSLPNMTSCQTFSQNQYIKNREQSSRTAIVICDRG